MRCATSRLFLLQVGNSRSDQIGMLYLHLHSNVRSTMCGHHKNVRRTKCTEHTPVESWVIDRTPFNCPAPQNVWRYWRQKMWTKRTLVCSHVIDPHTVCMLGWERCSGSIHISRDQPAVFTRFTTHLSPFVLWTVSNGVQEPTANNACCGFALLLNLNTMCLLVLAIRNVYICMCLLVLARELVRDQNLIQEMCIC